MCVMPGRAMRAGTYEARALLLFVVFWAYGSGFRVIVPHEQIEYGVYGDVIIIYPKPDSICLRRIIVQELFGQSLELELVTGIGLCQTV